MDHPPSPNQAVSDVSSKEMEDQSSPSDLEARRALGPNEDREYGCKYCHKKFSNKQALGGHQNAHKVERAIEKTAQEMQNNAHFLGPYTRPGPVSYPGMGPFLGPYTRPSPVSYPGMGNFLGPYGMRHDFVDRFFRQQPGIDIEYGARFGPALAGYPYVPARNGPGFSNVYPGWGGPGPRNVSQFSGRTLGYVQNQGPDFGFPYVGPRSSGQSRPFFQEVSGFGVPRMRPDGNAGGVENRIGLNNRRNDSELPDHDSGLDLSLKL